MHEEPEAKVTQADAGWEWTPGCQLGNVTLPLNGWVYIQEVPSTTFVNKYSLKYFTFTLHLRVTCHCAEKECPQLNPAQPYNYSFNVWKKSNNFLLLIPTFIIFWQKTAFVLLLNVLAYSQKLHRAPSARLDSKVRRHLCDARTKWEFSTWIKGDLKPTQSRTRSKFCYHPQLKEKKIWTKSVYSHKKSFLTNCTVHIL